VFAARTYALPGQRSMLQALLGQKCEVCGGVSASFERLVASKSGGTCFASLPKSNKSTQDTSEWKMRFLFAGSSRCVERATKHPTAPHHQETLMTMATGIAVRVAFETASIEFFSRKPLRPPSVRLRQMKVDKAFSKGPSGRFTNVCA
jgi:hypothetical protein